MTVRSELTNSDNIINFIDYYRSKFGKSITDSHHIQKFVKTASLYESFRDRLLAEGVPSGDAEKIVSILTQVIGHDVNDMVVDSAGRQAVVAPPKPSKAPQLWEHDRGVNEKTGKKETPPEFIKRVYEPWHNNGLTRTDIKTLDDKLYRALYNWLRLPENDLPSDFYLPTQRQYSDDLIRAALHREVQGDLGGADVSTVNRLKNALRWRTESTRQR